MTYLWVELEYADGAKPPRIPVEWSSRRADVTTPRTGRIIGCRMYQTEKGVDGPVTEVEIPHAVHVREGSYVVRLEEVRP